MNSWKEHPHLFANGKFRIRFSDGKDYPLYGVQGLFCVASNYRKEDCKDCTLITRRIESMTKEEKKELVAQSTEGFGWPCSVDGMLYLLSIGVYPFDQKHFDLPDDDPAKVINIKTI